MARGGRETAFVGLSEIRVRYFCTNLKILHSLSANLTRLLISPSSPLGISEGVFKICNNVMNIFEIQLWMSEDVVHPFHSTSSNCKCRLGKSTSIRAVVWSCSSTHTYMYVWIIFDTSCKMMFGPWWLLNCSGTVMTWATVLSKRWYIINLLTR